MTTRIASAHPASVLVLAHTIATSFFNLSASKWLVPDPDIRTETLALYFREPVAWAAMLGTAYADERGVAAAIWLPMPAASPPLPEEHDAHLLQAAGGSLGLFSRFVRFEAAQESAHPSLGEHWYLPLMGVQPFAQRQGCGSALLNVVHGHLDENQLPAYLEAASEELVKFYQRFGYVVHGNPVVLDGKPLLWPMIRYPNTP